MPAHDLNEALPRERFREYTERDFEIFEEVPGTHLLSSSLVKADFVCRPRPSLCQQGFPQGWFVVETKYLDFAQHDSKRLYESFWQTVTYGQSEFNVMGQNIRPAFTAFVVTEQRNQALNAPFQAQKRRWQILMELGVYANLGFFEFEQNAWVLWFGQARLFHSKRGLSNIPCGLKTYVGSRTLPRPNPSVKLDGQ